jgi:Glycosyl hydrolase catalytic core
VASHGPSRTPRPRDGKRITIALASVAACFAIAGFGSAGPVANPGPSVAKASDTSPASARGKGTTTSVPPNFFGFTPDFGGVDDPTLSAYYKNVKQSGASWVRFGIYWWYIEKTRGTYTWNSTDRYVAAIACSGLTALPMFIGAPTWASGKASTTAPPKLAYLSDYETVIRAAIARYGVGGSYWAEGHHCLDSTNPVPASPFSIWQVWNEPNVMSYYGDQAATAQGYGRLLVAADDAINTSVNPTAKTVMGGLTGSRAPDFLTALYTAVPDLNSHVDIFDVHAYATTPQNSLTLLRAFRQTANVHGATTKPLWVSEVAWSSCLQAGYSYPDKCVHNVLAKDEAGQRNNLTSVYQLFLANASALRLRRVAWYSWRDPDLSRATCTFCYGSAMLHRDGSPKPAMSAYTTLAGG